MAIKWRTLRLSEAPLLIIDGDRGVNYPKASEFNKSGYCLFLNTGNVTTTGFDFAVCQFIAQERDALLKKGRVQRNDVVLTTRGSVGNTAFYDHSVPYDNIRINSGMVILRPCRDQLNPRYLYAFVRSLQFRSQAHSLTTGSAQPQLPIRDIRRIEIALPPLVEQEAIAKVIGTLDDKIELNRQMNQTLDEIARTLFKSWFVDFDPVRAKMEGRQPEGMDADTAALFPDRLVASELGPIPEGWSMGTLGEIATLSKTTVRPDQHPDEFFDHYSLPAFDQGQTPIRETGGRINSNKTLVLPNSILISKLNPRIPRVWMPAIEEGVRSICSTEFLVLAPTEAIHREFLFSCLVSPQFQNAFQSRVTGTTGSHQRVTPDGLMSIQIPLPSDELIDRFSVTTQSNFGLMECNRKESATLAELRDTLLPELLSGRLQAPVAADFVGKQM